MTEKGLDAQFLYKYLNGNRFQKDTAHPTGRKSGTSDIAMLKGCKCVAIPGGWANGFVAMFDGQTPTRRPKGCDTENDAVLESTGAIAMTNAIANGDDTFAVYPVAVAPHEHFGKIVKFSDGNGNAQWFDSRYVTAMLKRVNRKQTVVYGFAKFDDEVRGLTVAQNGKVVGFLMPTTLTITDEQMQKFAVTVRYNPPAETAQPVVEVAQPQPVKVKAELIARLDKLSNLTDDQRYTVDLFEQMCKDRGYNDVLVDVRNRKQTVVREDKSGRINLLLGRESLKRAVKKGFFEYKSIAWVWGDRDLTGRNGAWALCLHEFAHVIQHKEDLFTYRRGRRSVHNAKFARIVQELQGKYPAPIAQPQPVKKAKVAVAKPKTHRKPKPQPKPVARTRRNRQPLWIAPPIVAQPQPAFIVATVR